MPKIGTALQKLKFSLLYMFFWKSYMCDSWFSLSSIYYNWVKTYSLKYFFSGRNWIAYSHQRRKKTYICICIFPFSYLGFFYLAKQNKKQQTQNNNKKPVKPKLRYSCKIISPTKCLPVNFWLNYQLQTQHFILKSNNLIKILMDQAENLRSFPLCKPPFSQPSPF